jgi:hypothetical protein
MLAISLATIWWAHRAKNQQNAVASISKMGGVVRYNYEYDAAGDFDVQAQPPGPAWLRELLGIDYFSRVRTVDLAGDSVADTDLECLESLPYLRILRVGGPRVTDAGLVHLKHLRRLEELLVAGPGVTDAGLANLQSLRELRTLEFSCCSITDGGMQYLAILTNLRTLKSCRLSNCAKIFTALERPTTRLDFSGVPLSEVCEYVSDVGLVKISIEDAGLKDMPVAFSSTTGVPLGITLHAMLEPLGLDWYLSPNAVVITDRATVRARVEKSQSGLSKLKAALPKLTEVYVDW